MAFCVPKSGFFGAFWNTPKIGHKEELSRPFAPIYPKKRSEPHKAARHHINTQLTYLFSCTLPCTPARLQRAFPL